MKYRWSIAPAQPLLADPLARQMRISPLLAQCLLNRGLTGIEKASGFLQPRLKNLADPFLLPDMGAAVDRLVLARERGEPLVIFGDYDVDGVTSTALLLLFLRELGWKVSYYLPNRMEEGYGLSQEAVESCLRKNPAPLMLAVDCGSSTPASVAWLNEKGVEVIVLDHHQLSSPPPAAVALVNPHRIKDASEKNRPAQSDSDHNDAGNNFHAPADLCSVGLAFKLAHALLKRGRQTGLAGAETFDLRPMLDLVALGTIADLVPLHGENRILVASGLHRLNTTARPGLIAIKEISQCASPLGVHEVAFQLAPRLNAAGRMETAENALRLLLARNRDEALPLARELNERNRQRQALERQIADQVLDRVRSRFRPEEDYVIVEGQAPWHIGVVGIVASRVLQEFYRPTIIVGGEGEHWRGSGRSIIGFDLAGALQECGDLLVRHGGHAMAAGLTIQPDRLELLRQRLNHLAQQTLSPADLQPLLQLDAEVGLHEISLPILRELERLTPFGQANPPAQFFARNLVHQRPLQRIGADKQHVKMWVSDETTTHEAVWWGAGNESLPLGRFELAFIPQVNEYNGRRGVQLKVLDWRTAANP